MPLLTPCFQTLSRAWSGHKHNLCMPPADRVFANLRENNPELTGEKRRTIMKPPQVC